METKEFLFFLWDPAVIKKTPETFQAIYHTNLPQITREPSTLFRSNNPSLVGNVIAEKMKHLQSFSGTGALKYRQRSPCGGNFFPQGPMVSPQHSSPMFNTDARHGQLFAYHRY